MVSIRNPVAHGAAPDGLTIAALGLMDNLGLREFCPAESWQPVSISDKGSNLLVLGLVKVGDKVKFIAEKLGGAFVVTGLQVSR